MRRDRLRDRKRLQSLPRLEMLEKRWLMSRSDAAADATRPWIVLVDENTPVGGDHSRTRPTHLAAGRGTSAQQAYVPWARVPPPSSRGLTVFRGAGCAC